MHRAIALTGWMIVLAACGSAASGGMDAPEQPAPEENEVPETSPGHGDAVFYAPIPPTEYVLSREDSVVMELPGGGSQVQAFDRMTYVTLRITGMPGDSVHPATAEDSAAYQATDDSASLEDMPDTTYQAAIVLDSIRAEAGGMVPPDSLAAAAGTRWTASLTPRGELLDLQIDTTGTAPTGIGQQAGMMLQILFPDLPAGGARDDAQWVDTVETTFSANDFEVVERAIVNYSAVTEERDDRELITIQSNATFEQTGSGGRFGQEMEMSGSGARQIVYLLDMNGALVSASGSDSTAMTIVVPAVGQSVPVQQSSRFTIERAGGL